MKGILITGLAALATSPLAWATTDTQAADQTAAYEQVSDFHYWGHLDGWRPIDGDTLILWATPFRPYLVELTRKSPDLPFAEAIGVTSTVGKVYAKLDSVLVGGTNYPIAAIYKLTRDEARNIRQIQTVHREA